MLINGHQFNYTDRVERKLNMAPVPSDPEAKWLNHRIIHPLAFEDEVTPIKSPKWDAKYIVSTSLVLMLFMYLVFPILNLWDKIKYRRKHGNK